MRDLIDRQAAKDVIHKRLGTMDLFESRFNTDIDQITPIDPESLRPQGEWKISSDGYYPYCSNCKDEPKNGVMTKFCPGCGAYMKGAGEDA